MSIANTLPTWSDSLMNHRAVIRRNLAHGQDHPESPGYEAEPDWQIVAVDVPCHYYADFRSGFSGEFIDVDFNVVRRLYRVLFPHTYVDSAGAALVLTDVRERDEIVTIQDRIGNVIQSNFMDVRTLVTRIPYHIVFVEVRL